MKVFNTTSGILVQYDDGFRLLTETGWDHLVNDDNVFEKLNQLHKALPKASNVEAILKGTLLPPMQGQELWASGVTYLRSKEERQHESKESGAADFYQRVYEAERPELFFKANARRVAGPAARRGARRRARARGQP